MGILVLNNYGAPVPAPAADRGRARRARHPARAARRRRPDRASSSSAPRPRPASGRWRTSRRCSRSSSSSRCSPASPTRSSRSRRRPSSRRRSRRRSRGRVFGILNMLVSVASFLPIIIVGPGRRPLRQRQRAVPRRRRDLRLRHPLDLSGAGGCGREERKEKASRPVKPAGLDPVSAAAADLEVRHGGRRASRGAGGEPAAATPTRRRLDRRASAADGRDARRGRRRRRSLPSSPTPTPMPPPRATLVVRGRIATLAGDEGPGWVEAIAIADGRVVAAGTRDDVDAAAGPGHAASSTSRPTRSAVPGPDRLAPPPRRGGARAVAGSSSRTPRRSRSSSRGCAPPRPAPGPVTRGSRAPAGTPTRSAGGRPRDDLERAAPGRRVALWAHDHHALLASRRALAEAGVGEATSDPGGGVIRRDADGLPTGVLHEVAARLVAGRIPPPSVDDAARRRCGR